MTAAPTTLRLPVPAEGEHHRVPLDPAGQPSGVVSDPRHGAITHCATASWPVCSTPEGWWLYAQDHRGHGATASSEADYGVLGSDGWTELVAESVG